MTDMVMEKRKRYGSMVVPAIVLAIVPALYLIAWVLSADAALAAPDRLDNAEVVLIGPSGYRIPKTVIGTNILVNNDKAIRHEQLYNDVLVYQPSGRTSLNPHLVRLASSLKLGIIRYPGGQESESYHWGKGIGPVDDRKDSRDSYGREYRQYLGILEIARFAEAVGAQLLLTVNYSTGSPQEAKNLVEFCNAGVPAKAGEKWTIGAYRTRDSAPKGYFAWLRAQLGHPEPVGVRYWEIGNEIYFTKDRSYLGKAHAYARAMKEVDGSIKIGVTADPLLYWNRDTFLKNRPDIDETVFDWLSLHVYSFPQRVPMETVFTSNGRSGRTFSIGNDGEYRLCVLARGTRALGAPEMQVDVDGIVRTFRVDSEKWKEYCLSKRLVGPTHNIAVSFTNDLLVPGVGDRNLYVKDVVIGDNRESVWNRRQDEYRVLFGSNRATESQIARIGEFYPRLKIFVTEASPGYGLDEAPMDRIKSLESAKLKSAIWFAGLLNTAFRQRVEVVNQFPFNGRLWGFNLVRENGGVSPVYDVMKMYSAHVNNELLDISISSPKFDSPLLKSEPLARGAPGVNYLDAVASLSRSENAITLTLLNRSSDRNIGVTVDGGKIFRSMRLKKETLLTGQADKGMESSRIGGLGEINEETRTNLATNDVVVPAHSIVNLRYRLDQPAETVQQ